MEMEMEISMVANTVTGKRYCLYGTVILGFLSRVIDCYGIPGSRLYGTVLAEVVPLATTVDRLTSDYGTVPYNWTAACAYYAKNHASNLAQSNPSYTTPFTLVIH